MQIVHIYVYSLKEDKEIGELIFGSIRCYFVLIVDDKILFFLLFGLLLSLNDCYYYWALPKFI